MQEGNPDAAIELEEQKHQDVAEEDVEEEEVVNVTPPPLSLYTAIHEASMASVRAPGQATKYTKRVPLLQLFRFATKLDVAMTLLSILAGIGSGALMPIFMGTMSDMVDAFSFTGYTITSSMVPTTSQMGGGMADTLNKNVNTMLILGAINFVLKLVESFTIIIAASRQADAMRKKYFESALAQEMGFYDAQATGKLTTVLTDIQKVQDGIGERIAVLFMVITTVIGGYAYAFTRGWQMALVIIAAMPVVVICVGIVSKVMQKLVRNSSEFYARAGQVAEEILACIRTVVSFSIQRSALSRYNSHLVQTRKMGTKKGFMMGLSFGLLFFIIFSAFGLAFWYGSTLVEKGSMTAGEVLTVFMGIMMGTMSISQLAPITNILIEASGAAYEIFQTIDRKSLIDPRDKSGDQVEIEGNVEFRGVTFRYPTRPEAQVLSNFDLKIQKGQTVALVGPSGCGKSTVVGLLERFYDVEDGFGKVLIDGHPIKSINLQCLRRQIGIVSQEPVLFAKTIGENIAYGCNREATREEIIEVAKQANAHDFISALPDGYNTLVGERGVQLSGGQKQRIAIARALIRRPKILIFDEATSALDTESERVVQAAIDQVAHGRTCIIIAHRLSTVRNADLIATIHENKVTELGTHDELMALNGLYRKLVERQQLQGGNDDKHRKHHNRRRRHHQAKGSETHDVSPSVTPIPGRKSPGSEDQVEIEHETEKKLVSKNKFQILRRAFGLLRNNAWSVSAATVAAAVNGAIFPCFALVMAEIIQALIWIPIPGGETSEEHRATIRFWALGFVLLGIISMVVQFVQYSCIEFAGERMNFYLRLESFKAMLRQEIGWYDDRRNMTGVLTTRLATDATLVHQLTGSQLTVIAQMIASVAAGIVVGFVGNWKIALVVSACVPVIVGCSYIHASYMMGYAQRQRKAYEQTGRIANEAFENVRTVVSLTRETTFTDDFTHELTKPARQGLRSTAAHSIGSSVQSLAQFWVAALAFWYGGKLMQDPNEHVDISGLMKAQSGIMFGAMSIGQLASFFPDYGKCLAAAFNIFALFDRKSAVPYPDDVRPTTMSQAQRLEKQAAKERKLASMPVVDKSHTNARVAPADEKPASRGTIEDFVGDIEFRDVTFSYPTRPGIAVLQGMSFRATPQQTVALVGQSGCGKSTVISLLERFYDPTSGTILLDGRPTTELDIEWMRGQIGLVSQEPILFATTIEENIRYGKPGATHEEVVEAAKQANAHGFICSFPDGYNTLVGEKGVTLSGGQKQRIAIARALIRNPKILLLDEATSALDSESEKVVQEALDRARLGRTTIVIAHRLSTIRDADKILVVQDGKVVEQGTHNELMALNGLYTNLASAQA